MEDTISKTNAEEAGSKSDEDTDPQEENEFTYEMLEIAAGDVKLPSSLWALHKHPKGRFIAFNRFPPIRTNRLIADKGVVFAESLVPAVFFREIRLKLPPGIPTQPLESVDEVSAYLQKIHRLAFCTGTGVSDPTRSLKCRIYVDMPNSEQRCTACNSQRLAILLTAQEMNNTS